MRVNPPHRRSLLVPLTAAMALLITACGSDDSSADIADTGVDTSVDTSVDAGDESGDDTGDGSTGLRAPSPIEASGTGSAANVGEDRAAASTEEVSADMTIAPGYIVTDFVVAPDLPALPDNTTGYVFDAASDPTAEQVAQLAAAFGVAGEPQRLDDGFTVSWRVGPEDGSAPSIVLWDDAMLAWNYNSAWLHREEIGCASAGSAPVIAPDAGSATVDPAMPSETTGPAEEGATDSGEPVTPDDEVVLEPVPDDCVAPEPPENVPSAAEAEAMSVEHLTAIGVDAASVTFETWADEWSASVTANSMFDGVVAQSWGFTYGENGELQYAWGNAATPEPVGPYTLIDLDAAIARLEDGTSGFSVAPGRGDAVGVPEPATVTNDPALDAPATDEPAPMPVEPDGGIGDGAEPLPEPEEITVTLVDVEADLWWVWDVHGSVWLVPAYRFIGEDGTWYTVPAVVDDFLVQVEPSIPEPEPMPDTPPADPGDPASVQQYLGLPLDEFTAEVEADGFGPVRVVEIDGVPQAVTMDLLPGRVNVDVETRDGVQYVVGAMVEGAGEDVPASPTTAPDSVATTVVPIAGIHEGVSFYPACGTEVLEHEGVTWYTLSSVEVPTTDPEHAELLDVIRRPDREPAPIAGVNGFVARVVDPGPGDDVGTLVVWADGVARFVSDSGTLDVWLVDDELTYAWVC